MTALLPCGCGNRCHDQSLAVAAQIFYLNENPQPALRKHIDGLPALYLDCDTDIDLERDLAAKEEYARQIKDFSDHVRALRESRWALISMLCLDRRPIMHRASNKKLEIVTLPFCTLLQPGTAGCLLPAWAWLIVTRCQPAAVDLSGSSAASRGE